MGNFWGNKMDTLNKALTRPVPTHHCLTRNGVIAEITITSFPRPMSLGFFGFLKTTVITENKRRFCNLKIFHIKTQNIKVTTRAPHSAVMATSWTETRTEPLTH